MKNKKKFMIGAFSIGLTAIAVAIVIALNVFVSQLPTTITKPDTTPEKLATVGADSKKVLKDLDSEITIYRVYSDTYTYQSAPNEQSSIPLDINLKNLLEKYDDASNKITVKEIDPVEKPDLIKKYTDTTLNQNSLIIVSEKRSICINATDFYRYEIDGYAGQFYSYEDYYNMLMYEMYYGSGQQIGATEYFFGENEITGAIDYVNSDNIPVVYELSGHGEASVKSGAFCQMIIEENAEIKTLELLSEEKVAVPKDCAALIIYAPSADLADAEKDALISYVEGGGKVILLSYHKNFLKEKMPNFTAFTKYMGLEAVEGMVAEGDSSKHYPEAPTSIFPVISGNGITKSVAESNVYLWMDEAHGITPTGDSTTASTSPLLTTTEKGYLYTDKSAADPESAAKSTYGLAYQSTAVDEDGNAGGSLYWFATPYFIYDGYKDYANGEIFRNIFTDIFGKTTSISIIGKPLTSAYLQFTEQSATIIQIVILAAIPAISVIAGFAVWYGRRRR